MLPANSDLPEVSCEKEAPAQGAGSDLVPSVTFQVIPYITLRRKPRVGVEPNIDCYAYSWKDSAFLSRCGAWWDDDGFPNSSDSEDDLSWS
ncbi:hypothetical protein PC120_g21509 [Phytophthora cactorum]|nr:hypothetical protein PC120_g21509 [Phytophthora cactorum]